MEIQNGRVQCLRKNAVCWAIGPWLSRNGRYFTEEKNYIRGAPYEGGKYLKVHSWRPLDSGYVHISTVALVCARSVPIFRAPTRIRTYTLPYTSLFLPSERARAQREPFQTPRLSEITKK